MRRIFALCLWLGAPLTTLAQPGGFPTPVETARVEVRPLESVVASVGSLLAEDAVTVRPEVAGLVDRLYVPDGARVKAGAPLIGLESALLRAEHREAVANLERSRRSYRRAEELVQQQLLARADYDQAKSDLGVDEARVQSARIRLEKATVRAPFAGVLGLIQVSRGDYVQVGQALVNLVKLDPMRVDFRVPERVLAQLRQGLSLRVKVDAWPNRTFNGKVIAVDPQIDPDTRSVLVRATVENADEVLRPGLFAHIELVLARREQALWIPERALWPLGARSVVFRVVDGKAQQVQVEPGQREPGLVEIRGGLAAGDVVVAAGQGKLYDGAPVSIPAAQ